MTLSVLILTFLSVSSATPIKLSPQNVVDLAMTQGWKAAEQHLISHRADLALAQSRGVYDWTLIANSGYKIDRSEDLSGTKNPEDKIFNFSTQLAKKFSTGTTATATYDHLAQNSTLSTFGSSLNRTPTQYRDVFGFRLKQELLRNSFGVNDRRAEEVARKGVEISDLDRKEKLEDVVLDEIKLYWGTYISKELLQSAIKARDKYQKLVESVKRKSGLGIAQVGELARVQAEFEGLDQKVIDLSAKYLAQVNQLLKELQIESKEDVVFDVPSLIPEVGAEKEFDVATSRKIMIANLNIQKNEVSRDLANLDGMPEVNLIGEINQTGIDQRADRATAEMSGGDYPTYFVGVEFRTYLGSEAKTGAYINAKNEILIAENQLKQSRDKISVDQKNAWQNVFAKKGICEKAQQTFKLRSQVVTEQERGYSRGRVTLSELILSFNNMFDAESAKVKAIGDFHIALNELAALRDELVK